MTQLRHALYKLAEALDRGWLDRSTAEWEAIAMQLALTALNRTQRRGDVREARAVLRTQRALTRRCQRMRPGDGSESTELSSSARECLILLVSEAHRRQLGDDRGQLGGPADGFQG
jgi:hypothetical protein